MSEVPAQVWVGDEPPKPEKVDRLRNTEDGLVNKPKGGMWTSSLVEDNGVSSHWIQWMQSERWCNIKEPHKWVLEPEDDVEVYVIDSVADAREVMKPDERYSSIGYERYRIDWAEVFGIRGYDAIRLTRNGQIETRFPGDRRFSLHGWDCECVLWEEWSFTDVEYAGEVEIPSLEVEEI